MDSHVQQIKLLQGASASHLKTGNNGIYLDYSEFCETWHTPTTFLSLSLAFAALSVRQVWPPYLLVRVLLVLQRPASLPPCVCAPCIRTSPALFDPSSRLVYTTRILTCNDLWTCLGISFQGPLLTCSHPGTQHVSYSFAELNENEK